MGFFGWLSDLFRKNKKDDDNGSQEERRVCSYKGCELEPKNLCPFCGKMFCNMHKDPIDHECHKRRMLKSNKKRNTPTSFEEEEMEVPQAPKMDNSDKKDN